MLEAVINFDKLESAFVADLVTELSIVITNSVYISVFSWQCFTNLKRGEYELVSSYVITYIMLCFAQDCPKN